MSTVHTAELCRKRLFKYYEDSGQCVYYILFHAWNSSDIMGTLKVKACPHIMPYSGSVCIVRSCHKLICDYILQYMAHIIWSCNTNSVDIIIFSDDKTVKRYIYLVATHSGIRTRGVGGPPVKK